MAPRGYRKYRFRLWRRRLKAQYRGRVTHQTPEGLPYEEPRQEEPRPDESPRFEESRQVEPREALLFPESHHEPPLFPEPREETPLFPESHQEPPLFPPPREATPLFQEASLFQEPPREEAPLFQDTPLFHEANYQAPAERARDEAYEILAQARQTATEIVRNAQQRADAILTSARTQAQFLSSETRNLSQEFLDSLRLLGHRAPAPGKADEPTEIVRRLSASPPTRPDIPGRNDEGRPSTNGSSNGGGEAGATRFRQPGGVVGDPSEPGPAA